MMQQSFTLETMVAPSMCDGSAKMSVPYFFAAYMDIAATHSEATGLGVKKLMEKGLFWLAVKTMIRIHRRPALTENVALTTWPNTPEGKRCLRYYTVKEGEELLAEGKTEWAMLNAQTMQVVDASNGYPEGFQALSDTACAGDFSRISEDFSEGRTVGTYRVASTDIDFGGHMNNAAYVRAIFSLFSSKELKAMRVKEMEIIYRTPCFEGDTLTLKARQANESGRIEWGLFNEAGRAVALGRVN